MTSTQFAGGAAAPGPVVHKTRTWERDEGLQPRRYKSGMRHVYTYGWICSYGESRITGSTRQEARRSAQTHRENSDA